MRARLLLLLFPASLLPCFPASVSPCYPAPMKAEYLTPILNVSDISASFTWFEKWGWKKLWDWGTPPDFGAVGAGDCTIFLCLGYQGGRGKGSNTSTFGPNDEQTSDKGVWLCLKVENVDEVHKELLAAGLEITWPPTDTPWKFREMHLRHPDGHVFRIGHSIDDEE
jgi:hypothetical protein